MQIKWPDLLFVRLLLPYLVGTLIGIYHPDILYSSVVITIGAIMFALLHRRARSIHAILINTVLIAAGWLSISFTDTQLQQNHYSHNAWQAGGWIIEVSSPPKVKADLISFDAKVLTAITDEPYSTKGTIKVYLNIPEGYPQPEIAYGDRLNIPNELGDVKPPANPYEFDYQQYLSYKGISQQAYLYPGQWKLLKEGNKNTPVAIALSLRNKAAGVIYEQIPDSNYAALVNSMLLGDRTQLNDDITQAFSISGAMHVLAISGLHVGILYGLIQYLLSMVAFIKRRKKLFVLLIILLLSFYALLTGLSPSVLRATVMVSFLIIGDKLMPNKAKPLNSLAASALLLLVIQPTLIYQVGFWLSYTAVVGILLIYPPLYKALYFKNKALNWLWQLTAVSVAAQIATLPITMFVFHQLPMHSLFSNVVVIPATSIILGLGSLLLTTFWIPYLSTIIAKLLYWTVFATSWCVEYISKLPGASLKGLYLNYIELALWIVAIVSLVWFMHTLKARSLQATLLACLLLLGIDTYYDYEQNHQQQLTVYSVHGSTAVDLFHGRTNHTYMDSTIMMDTIAMERKLMPNRWACGIRNEDTLTSMKGSTGQYFLWNNERVAIIGKSLRKNIPYKPLQIDKLILTDNMDVDIEYITQCYQVGTIIFDRSNSPSRIKKWEEQCRYLGIDHHNAAAKAYVAKL